jgi:hypothetical protein
MDQESYETINNLKLLNIEVITNLQLEKQIPDLINAKSNRTKVEYYYTCSPAICSYVFSVFPNVDMLTYLDADLYFFSSPNLIFSEIGDASIAVIEHNFNWITKSNIKYGRFNVGWISFRRDSQGLRCLEEWQSNCLDWCYQKLFQNKYADQKYLDYWPEKYDNLKIIKQKGANLAIWNIGNYNIKKSGDKIFVNNDQLVFYHFANLKQLAPNTYTTGLSRVMVFTTKIIKYDIYYPYLYSLKKFQIKPFVSKMDIHLSPISNTIKHLTRLIRQLIFSDIIHIN